MTKMCNDCRWCGSGWFLLSQDHRTCHHPLVAKAAAARNPSGDGSSQVGIERKYSSGPCGWDGALWNTDKNGALVRKMPQAANAVGAPPKP